MKFRGFTSFMVTFSFLLLTVTGLVLFVVPPGRVANWHNWTLLGFTKDAWQTVHTVFAFIFVVFGLIHLFVYNWKVFLGYVRRKKEGVLNLKKELAFSTALTLLVAAGSFGELPPFSTIMKAGEGIKNSWYTKEQEPPIPHAELFRLTELADKLKLDIEDITRILEENNIQFKSPKQRLGGIARKNKMSAKEIFGLFYSKKEE